MSEVLAEFYVVEKIFDKRFVNGKPQYLVKWENYDESENTWEPLVNLTNVRYLVNDFEDSLKNKGTSIPNPVKLKVKRKGRRGDGVKRIPCKLIILIKFYSKKKKVHNA